MSQFLPESQQTDGQIRTPTKGPDAFLSRDEETFLARMLSHPESFPPQFKSWLTEHMAINMQPVPNSLIQGGSSTSIVQAQVLTSEATASTSYTNLATVGPTIENLADGNYLILFGARISPPNGTFGAMSVQVNSTAATDDDMCGSGGAGSTFVPDASASRGLLKTFSNNNNNTITAKYRASTPASTTFLYRWLVVMRVGN